MRFTLSFLGLIWTLSRRVKEATHDVAAVGALPYGFTVKLFLVRGKYLPAGLHAAEASYVSASSLSVSGLPQSGRFGPTRCPLLTPL